mmetsp:Transcript_58187/g.109634  ORF Transcript_58187/g.109634 Transcript_58187/m.109634 type:complete len:237 (+) Transcript_58187:211-921(+)
MFEGLHHPLFTGALRASKDADPPTHSILIISYTIFWKACWMDGASLLAAFVLNVPPPELRSGPVTALVDLQRRARSNTQSVIVQEADGSVHQFSCPGFCPTCSPASSSCCPGLCPTWSPAPTCCLGFCLTWCPASSLAPSAWPVNLSLIIPVCFLVTFLTPAFSCLPFILHFCILGRRDLQRVLQKAGDIFTRHVFASVQALIAAWFRHAALCSHWQQEEDDKACSDKSVDHPNRM